MALRKEKKKKEEKMNSSPGWREYFCQTLGGKESPFNMGNEGQVKRKGKERGKWPEGKD